MNIITATGKGQTGQNMAMYVKITDNCIAVSLFRKNTMQSVEELQSYYDEGQTPYTYDHVIDVIKNNTNLHQTQVYGAVNLKDIDDRFETDAIYDFIGQTIYNPYYHPNRKDHELWLASYSMNSFAMHTPGLIRPFFNMLSRTYNSKETIREFLNTNHEVWAAVLLMPCSELPLESMENTLFVAKCDEMVIDDTTETHALSGEVVELPSHLLQKFLINVELEGSDVIATDNSNEYTINLYPGTYFGSDQLVQYPITIELESDAGYLPKKKIRVQNGQTKFKIYADRLESGDVIHLKVNFKDYTSAAEKYIMVI